MSLSTIVSQVFVDPKANWITPKTQLAQLIPAVLVKEVAEISRLIPDLANLIAEYAQDSKLTDWYTALERIRKLPEKIPPVPGFMLKILSQVCPEEICKERKPDQTLYTVAEKCTLSLVPEELGTISEFESVVNAYGEARFSEDKISLRSKSIFPRTLDHHRTLPPEPTHWVLHTDSMLNDSRGESCNKLQSLVSPLAKKTSLNWQVSNLRDTLATYILKKIAIDRADQLVSYSTHVKEKISNQHFVVEALIAVELFSDPVVIPQESGVAVSLRES